MTDLAGKLATIGLAEVFQNIAFNSHTGTLLLKQGDRKAQIAFEGGRIKAIRISDRPLDYIDIARRGELASDEVLAKAEGSNLRRTLKAYLLAAGDLDEQRYDATMASCVEEEILPLFGWKAASFSFEEGRVKRVFDKELLGCGIDLDPTGVAMEAARRHDEWESIEPYMPTGKEVRVPATADRVLELAIQARTAGKVTLAARRLEVALELDPDNLEPRFELVRLHERAGKKVDAARELVKLGALQAERGDSEGALESYERAMILAPADLDVLERILSLHESRGDPKRASKVGRRLAESLVAQGMCEDALPLYERLLKSTDRNLELHESMAGCLLKLEETGKAAKHLLIVGDAAFGRDDFRAARRYYERILSFDEGNKEATRRLEEIDTGAAEARVHRRRRRRFLVGAGLFVALLCAQLVREWFAQGVVHAAQHAAVIALAADNGDVPRVEALRTLLEARAAHPWTRGASLATRTARALLDAEIESLASRVEYASLAKDNAELLAEIESQVARIDALALPGGLEELWQSRRAELVRG